MKKFSFLLPLFALGTLILAGCVTSGCVRYNPINKEYKQRKSDSNALSIDNNAKAGIPSDDLKNQKKVPLIVFNK